MDKVDSGRTAMKHSTCSFVLALSLGLALGSAGCGPRVGGQDDASDSQGQSASSDGESDTAADDMAWVLDTFSSVGGSEPAIAVVNITLNVDGTVDFDKDACQPEYRAVAQYRWRAISEEEVEISSESTEPFFGIDDGRTRARLSRTPVCGQVHVVFPEASPGPNTYYRGRHCLSEANTPECFESYGQECGPPSFDCSTD